MLVVEAETSTTCKDKRLLLATRLSVIPTTPGAMFSPPPEAAPIPSAKITLCGIVAMYTTLRPGSITSSPDITTPSGADSSMQTTTPPLVRDYSAIICLPTVGIIPQIEPIPLANYGLKLVLVH